MNTHCIVPFCHKKTSRTKERFCSVHRYEFYKRKITPYKELPPIWAFKKCKHHGWKPFEHFYYHKPSNSYICKPFTLDSINKKYCPIKNKLKKQKHWDTNRNASLKRQFGISQKDYLNMLQQQNNQCAICKKPKSNKNLDVDHCHKTKIVRGLLCRLCNVGLGSFRDNPELLEKAADYLRR